MAAPWGYIIVKSHGLKGLLSASRVPACVITNMMDVFIPLLWKESLVSVYSYGK